nr:reverse transcriptase domain-containing protein [Tanacetum cinerariifolium]
MSNQNNELKNMMASFFQMNTASTSGLGSLPSNTIANPKGEIKSITTRSGIVLDGPSVPIPLLFINPEEDERVEDTLTDQDLVEYTIKLHINITLADALILIPKYQKMLKALLSNKEKLLELANTPLNENYSAVILKKLPEKLGDPGKFLISCGFTKGSSEFGLHDHSNEQSSSKLVPKVVPPVDKTATSRQVLELLFHHHITMLRSTCK